MDIAVLHAHEEGGNVYVHLPSGRRPYEEVLTFLRKGTELLKYGRHGTPKSHPFRLSNDDKNLQWESKKGTMRCIELGSIHKWQRGQHTPVFQRHPKPHAVDRSFSIFYSDKKDSVMTLDVIAYSTAEFEMWFWGLQVITRYPPSMFMSALYNSVYDPVSPMAAGPVTRQQLAAPQLPAQPALQLDVPQFRASLTDDRPPKPTPKATPKSKTGLSVIVNSNRASGQALHLPLPNLKRDKREMGDLYVWGSLQTTEAEEWAAKNPRLQVTCQADEMRQWQQSSVPLLAANTQSMDVLKVACAPRHAALITRKGELYTWGYGRNGNLGHGWCTNVASPRLVTRMSGKGVRIVAVGEGATAAISADMRLYMWGSGLAGQLGNGYCFPSAEPMPVVFPGLSEDVRVLAVSCGAFHTAAVVEGGHLYTWGNGLFGKLGHGSHQSEFRPRKVEALDGKPVKSVSCGYWHTAAVVLLNGPNRPASTPNSSGTAMTPVATPASTPPPASYQQSPLPTARQLSGLGPSGPSVAGHSGTLAGGQTAGAGAGPGAANSAGGGGAADGSTGAGTLDVSVKSSVTMRQLTTDLSSSGSDLQLTFAAANGTATNGNTNNTSQHHSGSNNTSHRGGTNGTGAAAGTPGPGPSPGPGGGGGGGGASTPVPGLGGGASTPGPGLGGGGAGGMLRCDGLSNSVTSLDTLKDTLDESATWNPSAGVGALYTWGGDFSWVERLGEHGTPKRDHHGGCLGHGDKEGRLVPTRVRGDLDKHGVVQVACGWSMTIALSADGRVHQMGSTGAPKSAEKSCPWEGALVPTRVDGNLFGMYVEEVACGLHHVVVVASKVQANGMIMEDQRRIRLLSWGRGTEGQLGLDTGSVVASSGDGPVAQRISQVDYNLPQIVSAVDGKRVLHISAGGNHTMAVLEHDPRSRRSYPAPASVASGGDPYDGAITTGNPSGGGMPRGAPLPHPAHSVVGAVATSVREMGNTASGLLSMSTPFLSQSLPLSLQQMVVGGSRTRHQNQHGGGALQGPGGSGGGVGASGGSSSRAASARGTTRRYESSRLVAIPAPEQSNYVGGSARGDHHRGDLRRSAARLHHYATIGHGHPGAKQDGSAGGELGAAGRAQSMDPGGSVSSGGGRLGQRKREEPYSRSISPTSSSLYEISMIGDLQYNGNHHNHLADGPQPHAAAGAGAGPAPNGPAASQQQQQQQAAAHGHAGVTGSGAKGTTTSNINSGGVGDSSLMETMSHGGHSIAETAETEGDADSYFHGRRSLDMVPEQSEGGSPTLSPVKSASPAHLHHGGGGGPGSSPRGQTVPYLEGPEPSNSPTQLPSNASPNAVAMHPRVTVLSQPGTPGPERPVRSSVDTMDGSYTTGGSGSEALSHSGAGAASPVPYTLTDDATSSPAHPPPPPPPLQLPLHPQPQPSMPYSPHHMASHAMQHPQQPPPPPPLQPLEPMGRAPQPAISAAASAAAAASAVPGSVSVASRPREISISTWAHQASAVAAAAAGGASAAALQQQPPGGAPIYRSDISFRTYGHHTADGATSGASTGAPAGGSAGVTSGSRGSRSRGHSRNPSYDSADASARETDGSVAGGGGSGFDLSIPSFALPTPGASGAHTPPRLTGPMDTAATAANVALKQQNDLLQQQVEALKQQVALLAQAAGLGAAAAAAGGAAAVAAVGAGGHSYPPPLPPLPPSAQPGSASAAAAAAAGGMLVPAPPAPPVAPQQHPATSAAAAAAANMGTVDTASAHAAAPGNGGAHSGIPSLGTMSTPMQSHLSAPMPSQLQHAHSGTAGMPSVTSAAPYQQHMAAALTAVPYSHVLPPLGPTGSVARGLADRQISAAGAVPAPLPPAAVGGVPTADEPPPQGRHRRAASIDVSSLIATRDGIGPAKDYLAPAPSVVAAPQPLSVGPTLPAALQSSASFSHSHMRPHMHGPRSAHGHPHAHPHGLERVASASRAEGKSAMGHRTAPPALEELRRAHPGMSLAQAAVAEEENEGVDDEDYGYSEEDGEEEEEEEGSDVDEGEEDEEGDDEEGEADESGGGFRRLQSTEIVPDADEDPEAGACRSRFYRMRDPLPQGDGPPAAVAAGGSRVGSDSLKNRHAGASDASEASDVTGASGGADPHQVQHQHQLQYQQHQHQLQEQQRWQQLQQQHLLQLQHQKQLTQLQQQQQQHQEALLLMQVAQQQQQQLQKHVQAQAQAQAQQMRSSAGASTSAGGSAGAGGAGGGMSAQWPVAGQGGVDAFSEVFSGYGDAGSSYSAGGQPQPTIDGQLFQYEPGVYIYLIPPATPGGKTQLVKLRFSRRHFSTSEAASWWQSHKVELQEIYDVWPHLLRSGGLASRATTPIAYPASPSAGPNPSQYGAPQQLTQPFMQPSNTSSQQPNQNLTPSAGGGGPNTGGGGGGGSGTGMYFSLTASPVIGLIGAGSGGAAVGHGGHHGHHVTASGGGIPRSSFTQPGHGGGSGSGAATAGGGGGGGGGLPSDPLASWADQVYDDPSVLLPPLSGAVGGGLPPRHNHSRSGSRHASGGAGGAGPSSASGGFQAASGGSGNSMYGGGGTGAVTYHHQHSRSRSGGAASSRSNRSDQ